MSTDGMLEEWGTRLFHGMPAKGKQTSDGKLIGATTLLAASLMSAGSVRAQVRSAVRPHAKQVMVKITGGGRGMKAVAAHFRYISRLGRPEVGGKGQSLELENEDGDKVVGKEGIEGLQYDWQRAGSFIPDESHRREVFNIVLSMPEGTPADQVRDAARAFAKETFEGHKYVFALHDDTGAPHVHLAVRAERMDGYRLNPRKADLQRWRERFAARLQDRGINAIAVRASARGLAPVPKQLWRLQAADQGRERKPRPNVRAADSLKQARGRAIEAWGHVANALAASPESQDQQLALEVVRYVGQQFGTTKPGRALQKLAKRDIGGIKPADPTLNNPERKISARGR